MGDALPASASAQGVAPAADQVWVTDSGEARMALSGVIGEGRARRLDRELRRLEGRALLLVLDLSRVLGAHPAALVAIGTAGHRAERERRRMWVVPPFPVAAVPGPDEADGVVVDCEAIRHWLETSGLTLVAIEETRAAAGQWRTT